ncbi:MAG: putative molybdenum carrier protein [Verrucomicrobiota bacterium]
MSLKIVSGGQTGVDRAALEWALDFAIECGGWCPAGRIAEDGVIDSKFPLLETPSASYSQRTEWNVRDSDGTVLVSLQPKLVGGSKLTLKFASKWNRPCLVLNKATIENPSRLLKAFVDEHFIETLNVAGPRESTESGTREFVRSVLKGAFGDETL